MENNTATEILTEQLLAAYRRKRASDGGESRAYVASEVYAAEHEIERLEKQLQAGSAETGGEKCPTCKHDLHVTRCCPQFCACKTSSLPGSREPEKLNNVPDPLDYFLVTYGFEGNNHARQMLISCWAAARQYERKQPVALAESSLSSPQPEKDDSSAPTSPELSSTQVDTTKEKQ